MYRVIIFLIILCLLLGTGLGISLIAYRRAKDRAIEQAERIAELGGRVAEYRRSVADIAIELKVQRERAEEFSEISRRLEDQNAILRNSLDDIGGSVIRGTDGVGRIIESEVRTAETLAVLEKYFHHFFRGPGIGFVD